MKRKRQKPVKIPWYLVPKEVLLDFAESTGFDPRKVKWTVTVDEKGKQHYGVAG